MTAPGPALNAVDWSVLGGYLLAMLGMGAYFARRQKNLGEYFLAGNRIPVWAAAISIVATSVSAVTFIGAPEDAYRGNLTYLSLNIAGFIAVALVAIFFVPVFYREKVTSIYQLIGARFGPGAQRWCSGAFMLGRVLASGARLYVAAVPFSLIAFGDLDPSNLALAIAVVATVATLYTMIGGLHAVIWTEVPQTVVFVGAAAVALALLVSRIPLSGAEMHAALASAKASDGSSKLTVLDWRLDASLPYSVWSAMLGFTLFNMAVYGADQDLAQRMLTCRSAVRGAWSAVLSNIIGLGVAAMFLAIGLLLYLFYQRPDLMGGAAPAPPGDSRTVFLRFILSETPTGLRGLMIAGVFAAAMSSLASAVAAMASTAVVDFYRPLRPGRSEAHYMRASRIAVGAWGAILAAFALVCVAWQQNSGAGLLQFAIGVMIFAYTGLLGVFLTALFTRRGNGLSAGLAIFAGFAAVLVMRFPAWFSLELPALSSGWQMLIGSALAFAVCAAGRPTPSGARA